MTQNKFMIISTVCRKAVTEDHGVLYYKTKDRPTSSQEDSVVNRRHIRYHISIKLKRKKVLGGHIISKYQLLQVGGQVHLPQL